MISLKNAKEIALMVETGKILAGIIKTVKAAARPGIILKELDDLAEKLIKKAGCKSAFLGYHSDGSSRTYPASICASVNDVVVHGVPGNYLLKEGDILKLDFGLVYPAVGGFNVDAAITIAIGKADKTAERLIEVTRQALMKGIERAKVGNRLGDISAAIQGCVEQAGFSVVKELTGHGIGRELHEDPLIYNYGKAGTGILLQPGMVLAIEPMVTVGNGEVLQRSDGSFVTKDGSLSAHFEHTVAVTSKGQRILTSLHLT